MKREIKFRAWDKKEKRMWWNVQNAYDTLGTHCCPDKEGERCENGDLYESSFGDLLNKDFYVVMQFTGLKDKNGKEIYEGDILRWRLGTHLVEWISIGDGADFSGWIMPGQAGYQEDTSVVEVIGNVHENPDLLK